MEKARQTTAPIPLNAANLARLPKAVLTPSYDRAALRPGIIHIGVGNFHRAHQAWFLHRLMEQGRAQDWAILGAGVRPYDAAMRDKLRAQDFLTTLIELDPGGTRAEVTGAMIDYLPVTSDNGPLIRSLADPRIRIVSLTVTEGGYYVSAQTGRLDAGHADIVHDVENPEAPRTVFGTIVAGLRQRRDDGTGPFTVMSCDNLRGNGDITRQAVLGLASLIDADLSQWIAEAVTFPNAMVDCIVPATGPTEHGYANAFGIADNAPVTHENFRQWVIEDRFCAGRPPLEEVGVTLTDDVHAYESMKIRILNAGHQVLANVGELLGQETISECMAHPLIRAFFRKVIRDEILPFVDAVPGMTPESYFELIERRFANPIIVDTVRRVAFDGSSRHPGFVLPVVADALAAGASVDGLALVEALWARMCTGTRQDGSVIAANDPHWDAVQEVARAAVQTPALWLAQSHYDAALAEDSRFAAAFAKWHAMLSGQDVRDVLSVYVGKT